MLRQGGFNGVTFRAPEPQQDDWEFVGVRMQRVLRLVGGNQLEHLSWEEQTRQRVTATVQNAHPSQAPFPEGW